MTVVAIHQPNFFPWLGYFDKIRRADTFVFLDHVQMQKTGGTWTNRVKILVGGKARWVTAPIERAFSGVRKISEIRFDESTKWREKLLKTLATNYGRAPSFAEAMKLLEPLISEPDAQVARYNIRTVTTIAAALGLGEKKLVLSSSLAKLGDGTHLLISIMRAAGGRAYLCGGGADSYQEDELFGSAGIQLLYQNLQHPVYPQTGAGEFVAGLSIVDALMNCGIRGTAALLSR